MKKSSNWVAVWKSCASKSTGDIILFVSVKVAIWVYIGIPHFQTLWYWQMDLFVLDTCSKCRGERCWYSTIIVWHSLQMITVCGTPGHPPTTHAELIVSSSITNKNYPSWIIAESSLTIARYHYIIITIHNYPSRIININPGLINYDKRPSC